MGGLVAIAAAVVLLCLLAEAVPGAAFALAAAAYLALWRDLPWRSLWRRPTSATFIAIAGASGEAAIRSLSHFGSPSLAGTAWLVVDAAIAVGGAYTIHLIIKGKLMPSIFDIVNDPSALAAFVSETSTVAKGGAFLDLSGIDQMKAVASIKARVIGQNQIVDQIATLIFRRATLRRPNKPTAVAMFVGATGSGKTELAKVLAETLAGGKLIRIDCNEMTESSSTQRLIGSPPGYLGSDQGGWLCRQISEKRSGVILLDEIEKAHPDVLKIIMGLLDEGRLTEQSTGQTFSATGFVILLTSNAEHELIAEIVRAVADPSDRAAQVKDALRKVFKPEQLARIDEIFAFRDLDRAAVVEIVGKFLMGFANEVGVDLAQVDTGLLIDLTLRQEKLAKYGVREVVRQVEKAVVDGMLDARAAGHKSVRIVTDGGLVRVLPLLPDTAAVRSSGVHVQVGGAT